LQIRSTSGVKGPKPEPDQPIRQVWISIIINLTIEIQRMWNVKTKVIPVIIGATGTISKSFRKYASNIPRKHEVKELHKTATLGTAHILRKVLIEKYNRLNTAIPRDIVCLRNISINTLHKGDDDDDNNNNNNIIFNCKWAVDRGSGLLCMYVNMK